MWDGYAAQAATLVDGVHDEPYLSVRYDDRYVYGDFNGDGLKDAAVVVIENNGGTAEWYTLAFLINDGKRFMHKASQFLDDRAIINSIRERNAKVVIDMFVHQEGDCRAGPTRRIRQVYAYEGPDRWGAIERSPYERIYVNGANALQAIYDTAIPAQIRATFDRTIHAPEACAESGCAFTVRERDQPVDVFSKKFIIVDVGPSDSGGMYATLVFDDALVPYSLELQDRGGGRYELRKMVALPGALGDGFIRQLQNPAYRQYWL
jgi:hypothetical protein